MNRNFFDHAPIILLFVGLFGLRGCIKNIDNIKIPRIKRVEVVKPDIPTSSNVYQDPVSDMGRKVNIPIFLNTMQINGKYYDIHSDGINVLIRKIGGESCSMEAEGFILLSKNRKDIESTFGENHTFTKAFMKHAFSDDLFDGINHLSFNQVKLHLARTFDKILPEELQGVSTFEQNDLFALFSGYKLSVEQAVLLSNLTNRKFAASTHLFDDFAYLKVSSDDHLFTLSTTTTKVDGKLHELAEHIKSIRTKNRVVISGQLNQEIASILNQQSVVFTQSLEQLKRDIISPPKKVQVIITPNDFKLQNATKLTDKRVKIATNATQLQEAIQLAKANNMHTIIVFKNDYSNSLFGKDIESYGFDDALTCESFKLDNEGVPTLSTDFIYIPQVLKSLEKIHTTKTLQSDEFLHAFSQEYSEQLKRMNTRILVAGGAGVLSTGGILATGIYYFQENKENKENNNNNSIDSLKTIQP